MTDFDWTAGPVRPLSLGDVWELLRNGCNAHEVATAAGVDQRVADAMVRRALDRQVLSLNRGPTPQPETLTAVAA